MRHVIETYTCNICHKDMDRPLITISHDCGDLSPSFEYHLCEDCAKKFYKWYGDMTGSIIEFNDWKYGTMMTLTLKSEGIKYTDDNIGS